MARSPQLARFLRYIVERRLRNDVEAIKAYSIAVDVFGRSPDFDPQSDPIVRVQARRLRSLIEQYYQGAGSDEALRITLPTGRYVPEFVCQTSVIAEPLAPVPSIVPPGSRWNFGASWLTLAAGTLLLALLAYTISVVMQQREQRSTTGVPVPAPIVSVTELQNLTGAPADVGMLAGLAVELVTDLQQFDSLEVVYGGSSGDQDMRVDYVLSGIIRRGTSGLQFSAIVKQVATNSVTWNKSIDVATERLADPELLNLVSGELSRTLGSPRGPLHRATRTMLREAPDIEGRESPYLCRVLFDLYRERATSGSGSRAERCFSRLPENERGSGQAAAARASLLVEGFIGEAADLTESEQLDLARKMLEEAVRAAPVSGFVWEQQARYLERIGDHNGAEAAYSSALQLNPVNTDTLAARARHLALVGRLAEAEPLSALAIGGAPNPPGWYLAVPSLLALRTGDFRLAEIYARSYAEADRELGPILVVMAAESLGHEAVVTSYLPRVLDVGSFRANGVLTQLRKRISDESLIRDVRAALLTAGVPPAVLNGPF